MRSESRDETGKFVEMNMQKSSRPSLINRELLFASGFGGSTRLVPAVGPYFHGPRDQYEDIVGSDSGMVHTWTKCRVTQIWVICAFTTKGVTHHSDRPRSFRMSKALKIRFFASVD